jgi:APA family basic amino acid/polyamine antiporter
MDRADGAGCTAHEVRSSRVTPRALNQLDATLLVMGGIVGVGIFFNPRQVAALVPDPHWFLALWLVGGIVALFGALTFAELGASLPEAGGWYVFLRTAFGPFLAFLFACVVLFVISTGAIAVMAEICIANLHGIVPGIGPPGSFSARVAGAIVIALVTLVTMMGVKAGAGFQNLCMLIKVAAILALIAGACVIAAPTETPPPPPATGTLTGGAIRALLPVLFSCGGWQMLCYVAPRVRDPQRTLPRAIVAGVCAVIVLYLGINAAYLHVLGIGGIASDPEFASTMARRTLGGTGGEILRAAMGVSALGVCIVTILATPWLYVAMAREGLFFAGIGRLHPRTGAPVNALLLQMVLALAYWFFGHADTVVDSVVFVEWIFHALVAIALLRLRSARPDLPRPFRSPLYPLAPIGYLAIAITVVAGNLVQANVRAIVIGLSVLVIGALVYRPWRALVAARA